MATDRVPLSRQSGRDWWENRARLADLADWLKEQGREPDDWAYFLRRPEKWTPEYRDMCAEEEQDQLAEQHAFGREGRYWPDPGGPEAA